MLKQVLLRQIEDTREALNDIVGNYEVGEDSGEIIELSHSL
ncbi:MAG: Spo0E family sporulation regulatory protein-aspartic acid phosphatase [Niameybacter sp.]